MQERIDKLRLMLAEKNIDALLVSNFYNILYLTGFKGLAPEEREAWVVVTKNNAYLMTDGRYYDQILNSKSEILNFVGRLITPEKNLIFHLREILAQVKIKKLGFESEDLKYAEYLKFKTLLTKVQFTATEKMIMALRAIKDDTEIMRIREACRIADECLTQIIKSIKVGQTEGEIAWKIEKWLKENDSDLAFYPIVGIDANSALPHYDTRAQGQKKVEKGSVILIDFGARYQDYMSDITRMIFVGKPKNEILKTYNLLLTAQLKTLDELKKSADPKHIDSISRKSADYSHSTGHGVGLEIHEFPKISSLSTEKIVKNQIITIEPATYLPGKFGMRIEDTVWMKEALKPEVLTKFPKNLTII